MQVEFWHGTKIARRSNRGRLGGHVRVLQGIWALSSPSSVPPAQGYNEYITSFVLEGFWSGFSTNRKRKCLPAHSGCGKFLSQVETLNLEKWSRFCFLAHGRIPMSISSSKHHKRYMRASQQSNGHKSFMGRTTEGDLKIKRGWDEVMLKVKWGWTWSEVKAKLSSNNRPGWTNFTHCVIPISFANHVIDYSNILYGGDL